MNIVRLLLLLMLLLMLLLLQARLHCIEFRNSFLPSPQNPKNPASPAAGVCQ
jgi:hypothetical protein